MSDMFQIYNDDCLKILKKLGSESVDLVFTSPPYNLGNTHHTGSKKTQAYEDDMPEEDYQAWQIDVLKECHRVLKSTGSMIYNHKNRIKGGVQITPYSWILKTHFLVKQEIVWVNKSQNFDKIRFYPFTERIYWLSKSKDTVMNNSVGYSDVCKWEAEGSGLKHSRSFPKKMVLDILKCFPESSIVLDPFMGSATVGHICQVLDKRFIGIEKDLDFFKYSEERLKNNYPETNKNSFIKSNPLF